MYPNTVRNITICDTNVFIIGEHANSSESGRLCADVIENEQPDLICIESCPEKFDFYSGSGYQSTVGAFAAEQYCREKNTELFVMDVLQSEASLELQLLPDSDTLSKDRPEFDTEFITEDGGITSTEKIEEYVEQNKSYNKERFDFIWNTRESFMANSIVQKLLSDTYNTVIVIVGLSHINRLTDNLTTLDTDTVQINPEFLKKRSFDLEFINLLDERDSEIFYEN